METFGQNCPEAPTIPDKATCLLRAKLIFEEALETIHGLGCALLAPSEFKNTLENNMLEVSVFGEADLVEAADGFADLLVVTHGAALACGINIYPVFNEVHRSNMSKLWDTEDGTKEVRKREDGKVLKPPTYSPANIGNELDIQLHAYALKKAAKAIFTDNDD